jgi:hypothetical protein
LSEGKGRRVVYESPDLGGLHFHANVKTFCPLMSYPICKRMTKGGNEMHSHPLRREYGSIGTLTDLAFTIALVPHIDKRTSNRDILIHNSQNHIGLPQRFITVQIPCFWSLRMRTPKYSVSRLVEEARDDARRRQKVKGNVCLITS